MKKTITIIIVIFLVFSSLWAQVETQGSYSINEEVDQIPLSVDGEIIEIEKFGHLVLNIKIKDFIKLGFQLGDTVNVFF